MSNLSMFICVAFTVICSLDFCKHLTFSPTTFWTTSFNTCRNSIITPTKVSICLEVKTKMGLNTTPSGSGRILINHFIDVMTTVYFAPSVCPICLLISWFKITQAWAQTTFFIYQSCPLWLPLEPGTERRVRERLTPCSSFFRCLAGCS